MGYPVVRILGWFPDGCEAEFAPAIPSATMVGETREPLDTRIGRLEFTPEFVSGYSTGETVTRLFDEIDFQRACLAYHPVIVQDFKKAEW